MKLVRDRKTFSLVLAFIFLMGSVHTSPAQGNDLESTASKIDKLIAKKNKTRVIVTDFVGPKDAVSEYGQAIADELSAELAKADTNLTVLPRDGQTYTFGNSGSSNDFMESNTAWFLAQSVGAEVVVTGNLKEYSDSVDLNFRVWDIPAGQDHIGGEKLGEFAVRLSVTPEQNILLQRTIPQDPSKGFRLTAGKKSSAYASFPACIACVPPTGPGKAEVTLLITISAAGLVTNVELVSASDQKIGEKVAKAAMKWRFRPARGLDGQPMATKIRFELSLDNKNE